MLLAALAGCDTKDDSPVISQAVPSTTTTTTATGISRSQISGTWISVYTIDGIHAFVNISAVGSVLTQVTPSATRTEEGNLCVVYRGNFKFVAAAGTADMNMISDSMAVLPGCSDARALEHVKALESRSLSIAQDSGYDALSSSAEPSEVVHSARFVHDTLLFSGTQYVKI